MPSPQVASAPLLPPRVVATAPLVVESGAPPVSVVVGTASRGLRRGRGQRALRGLHRRLPRQRLRGRQGACRRRGLRRGGGQRRHRLLPIAYLEDPASTCAAWSSADELKSARVGFNAVAPGDAAALAEWKAKRQWVSHSNLSCDLSQQIDCIEAY